MSKLREKFVNLKRISIRNKIIKKIGLDTDNFFSWMENERLTWNYKPPIIKKGNFLHANYIVFSELIVLLSRKNPDATINKKKVFNFLRKHKINLIKKKDIDQDKVNQIFSMLKIEREKNNWSSGDSDLRIISVYYVAGIHCISTNNQRDFRDPCKLLDIDLEIPSIIEPGSRQDVGRMWKSLYGKRYSKKRRKNFRSR